MTGIVVVALIGGDTNFHVFHLLCTILVIREGDQRLGMIRQARDRKSVLPLLVRPRDIQIHLYVVLGKCALVPHQCAHHTAHRVLGGGFAHSVYLGHGHIIVVAVAHTDAVDVYVVASLGDCVERDIDTSVGHIVGEVVRVQCPYRGRRHRIVPSQKGCCLLLRNQVRISDTTICGNLHSNTLIGFVGSVVMCEPQFQNRMRRVCQGYHWHDGTRNRTGTEVLGVEVETSRAVNRSYGGVHARAVLECPVTGTGYLLDCPGLLRAIAEVLLIVGNNRLQNEHLIQGVVA